MPDPTGGNTRTKQRRDHRAASTYHEKEKANTHIRHHTCVGAQECTQAYTGHAHARTPQHKHSHSHQKHYVSRRNAHRHTNAFTQPPHSIHACTYIIYTCVRTYRRAYRHAYTYTHHAYIVMAFSSNILQRTTILVSVHSIHITHTNTKRTSR